MRKVSPVLFVIFFSPFIYASANDAEISESSDTIQLDEIVITATRMEENILDVPEFTTVITAEDIEKKRAKDVAQLLSTETGIYLTDYGPLGSLQSVSLRGSTDAQVLVLVDGVRAVGSHGGADLSLIPLENVERIEIVRGGTSALYGADAVAES